MGAALKINYQDENKQAAKWLLEYPERRQAYLERMNSIQFLGAVVCDGMPHGTDTGRPAEKKGIRLADLDYDKRWIIAIEMAEQTLSRRKRAFLDIRRMAELVKTSTGGRPGWIDYTMSRYSDWHEREYGYCNIPTRQTFYKWWDEMVNIVVRIAIRQSCL
ncbi:MAG: hypothetical protein H6Q73_185 [Firmicutes bacterium]|nr:hypothetical protein [Bacillota bacterium]